ncbi:MAG: HD domain-containing protein [Calditerrivibrio sp.]|uniref:HD domain-containing protein n=1 Tax=Calditerrivibrio sp. TaxID=2792612 RepID=UPI003D0E6EBC
MLKDQLIKIIFSAANIQRWNDHIRPSVGFSELDKQAHKMFIAYILAKLEERKRDVNWILLIEGSIFEMLQRVIITDIKPPIYYKIVKSYGKELNNWVLNELKRNSGLQNDDFFKKFEDYFENTNDNFEKRILRAAHYLATNWEYNIIYEMNKNLYGAEKTKNEILSELKNHYKLDSVREFITKNEKLRNFVDLVGQLRYQKRWANTPRIPETTVLGHMYTVAIFSYFELYEKDVCNRLKRNTFLSGLFHDLPEVLTRDIISPVKKSVAGLDEIIKKIEMEHITNELLPLLPPFMHEEMRYLLFDEFKCKIFDSDVKFVSRDSIYEEYNKDHFEPVDGSLLKECDLISAYYEAAISIENGIKPTHLLEVKSNMENKYPFIRRLIPKKQIL